LEREHRLEKSHGARPFSVLPFHAICSFFRRSKQGVSIYSHWLSSSEPISMSYYTSATNSIKFVDGDSRHGESPGHDLMIVNHLRLVLLSLVLFSVLSQIPEPAFAGEETNHVPIPVRPLTGADPFNPESGASWTNSLHPPVKDRQGHFLYLPSKNTVAYRYIHEISHKHLRHAHTHKHTLTHTFSLTHTNTCTHT